MQLDCNQNASKLWKVEVFDGKWWEGRRREGAVSLGIH